MSKSMNTRADGELAIERVPIVARAVLKSAPSLRPGLAMMEAAAFGQPQACAVRDAWRFNFPVRTVSAEEFEAMFQKGTVTFHG